MVIQTNCMLCPRRTFRKSGTIGKTHFRQESVLGNHIRACSDVSSEPGKIALILNTTFPPRTVWQLREHPCLLSPRSTSDQDCQQAPSSKDTDGTKSLSFSTSSRVMGIVVCSQNHPTIHSSSLTAATSANTYSRLQHVFNPANGLMNILMKAYQSLWNESMPWRPHAPSNPLFVITCT